MPSPTLVGAATTAVQTGGSTIGLSRPAGVANGDYLVAILRGQPSNSPTDWTLAGWARLGPAFIASHDGRVTGFYGKRITDVTTEPSTYTFAHGSTGRAAGIMAAFRGVDTASPISGASPSFQGTLIAGGNRAAAFSIENPSLVLQLAANECTAGNSSTPTATPAGYTELGLVPSASGTTATRSVVWAGYRTIAAASTTDADTTWANNAGGNAEGIALRGAASTTNPSNPGAPVRDGTGAARRLFYTSDAAGKLATPKLHHMRPGFKTVAEMKAKSGFTVGHRGNSAFYAEGSLHAYTQTVARGYGALEVSLGRTLDGVWFALHDVNINRTSKVSGKPNASLMTWAEIQSYQITNSADGVPRPYARWEEIRDAYASSHVLFIDPKHAQQSYRAEFFALIEPLGPEKVVVKFAGDNVELANAAAVRGYERWGFFYGPDLDQPQFAARASAWTMLGLDYNDNAARWAQMIAAAGSKPVLGHVIPTQAGYDYVMAQGAKGAMISASNVVAAVGA